MVICRRSPPARSRVRTGSCRRRGGGPAAGARWRPTRAAAATAGLLPNGAARGRTKGPEDIRPPATTSRARPQGAKGTPKVIPKGVTPQRVPEERWSRQLEAPRPMRPGRENRGDATGRPTQRSVFGVPSSPFFKAGVRLGRSPGVDSARPVFAEVSLRELAIHTKPARNSPPPLWGRTDSAEG